jgi:hypothetical protein
MEASSENRRRGRPEAFSDKELSDAERRAALSRRQRQNRAYARRAGLRLADLWWWEELYEGPSVPQCVLAELGRIRDDAPFREAASWYAFSARDLTAKQAATKIKEMRTGTTPQEGPATLYERLVRTVEDFLVAYPGASLRYVEGQTELVLDTIRKNRAYTPRG